MLWNTGEGVLGFHTCMSLFLFEIIPICLLQTKILTSCSGFWAGNFFIYVNENYKTAGGAPARNQPVPAGTVYPFYIRTGWMLPTSWSTNCFKADFWKAGFGSYSHNILYMGPFKYGYRIIGPSPGQSGNTISAGMQPGSSPGSASDLLARTNMTAAESAALAGLIQRSRNAGQMWESVNSKKRKRPDTSTSSSNKRQRPNTGTSSGSGSGSNSTPEPDEDDFIGPLEPIPTVAYTCPRYDEIKQYLFANRAPKKLALDTMSILSEHQFYRYIRDNGGIQLTGMEFRSFLAVADSRGELFMYVPPLPSPSLISLLPLTNKFLAKMAPLFWTWHSLSPYRRLATVTYI